MSKINRQKKESKKMIQKKKVSWLIYITILLILISIIFILFNDSEEASDLSLVGKGKNVIVQVHDPGWGSCRELKRVVNSLKPEFSGKIKFLLANLNSSEGSWFAEYHKAGRVTLLFFNPEGEKISSVSNELDPQNLRKIFNRVFKF